MATRFYTPWGDAPPISPAPFAAWNSTIGFHRSPIVFPRTDTWNFFHQKVLHTGVNGQTVLITQFISDTIEAQNIPSQVIKAQFRARQQVPETNAFLVMYVFVVSNNGSEIRSILVDGFIDDVEMNGSQSVNRRLNPTSVAGQSENGDRIVVEIGAIANPSPGAALDVDIMVRDNVDAGDLPEDDISTGNLNNWIEFTTTLTGFGTEPDPPIGMPAGILHLGRSLVR